MMIDFSKIKLSDASIKDVRISPSSVEVDYIDWQEKMHTLLFSDAISCFVLNAYGKTLSHGEVEDDGEFFRECCEVVEEESDEEYRLFNFIEVWGDRKILRIIAKNVIKKT